MHDEGKPHVYIKPNQEIGSTIRITRERSSRVKKDVYEGLLTTN